MTTARRRRPPAPKDLGSAGAALWRSVLGQFDLHAAELALLHQLCCTADEITDLKAALAKSKPLIRGSRNQMRPNPLYAMLANHRKLADQLVVALGLPLDSETVGRRRSAAAKQSADARWRRPKMAPRVVALERTRSREGQGA